MKDQIGDTTVSDAELNVRIQKHWSTSDFAVLLTIISDLNGWFSFYPGVYINDRRSFGVLPTTFWNEYFHRSSPNVVEIRYSSPGGIRIIGIGDCLKQVRLFLMYCMDRDLIREEREIRNQAAHLALERDRLKMKIEEFKIEKARSELQKKYLQHLAGLLRQAKGLKGIESTVVEEQIHQFLRERAELLGYVAELAEHDMVLSIKLTDSDKGGVLEPA